MRRFFLWTASVYVGVWLIASCSQDRSTSTGSSPVSEKTGPTAPGAGTLSTQSAGSQASMLPEEEEFNCTNITEAHARFSHPGFVQDNVVGFFVGFLGVPDEPMTLRVWWDYEGDPGLFEDVPFADGDVFNGTGDLLNIEKVIEHTYDDVKPDTVRRVRVELILTDKTGNCARVRDVTVNPPTAASGSSCGGGLLGHDNGAGTGTRYCYAASDTVQQRALLACESHFGAGNCCVITGGYQDMQYGECSLGGGAGSYHWHWDNHPAGHCPPNYVVGDVVSPGWCGTVTGSFTN